ncbi:MAG: hypothetical protein PUB69_06030 [Desulfovibrionaceae bacterium]|nr:hypothetical protein [Desulfovibrionaceae bacterium]
MNIFFDHDDRVLLKAINERIDCGPAEQTDTDISNGNLHPHGIVELATSHESRMAYAVINLLGRLSDGKAEDRLDALRILRDEVMHSARTTFRINTARVLIQIMKEVVRARQSEKVQLRLVHDFRRAISGNPRLIRSLLRRHHLLEMPEEWNQLTMDHHVHDSNTKGRKTPTHLIMDAWIKGIRYLTVVYFNYIDPPAARELMLAAEIMGISVRIGIEFQAPFRGRFIRFTWVPRGFSDTTSVIQFLSEPSVRDLMNLGREISLWLQSHILDTLHLWNRKYRPDIAADLDVDFPPLDVNEFLAFVHTGQVSYLHLAEFINMKIAAALKRHLEHQDDSASVSKCIDIDEALLNRLSGLTPEIILEKWLNPECNPELESTNSPDASDLPPLLREQPYDLLNLLVSLRSGYRISLQLSRLSQADVLELLWDCRGLITHLEIFNLKEWQEGHLDCLREINELQIAINEGNAPHIKQIIRSILQSPEMNSEDARCRRARFTAILRDIPRLTAPYKDRPLRGRVGTDSTSHLGTRYGMGLAVPATLPSNARKEIRRKDQFRLIHLPIHLGLSYRETYLEPKNEGVIRGFIFRMLRHIWGFQHLGMPRYSEWRTRDANTRFCEKDGNLITMGGMSNSRDEEQNAIRNRRGLWPGFEYLNTGLANWAKIFIGFIPAMLTFLYTQDSPLLAWFGAVIWFAITGGRNVVQMVLAGGGFKKGSLLRWRNYVSWGRICDSLMYTGLSVVLLEWLIRILLLEQVCGLTVANAPIFVFTVISIANSFYICAHNIYRGFPRAAIIGNIFRTILAIPVSVLYNELMILLLPLITDIDPLAIAGPGAAIVSKAASDTVAGIIEGFADMANNFRLRRWDYRTKLNLIMECYEKLELLFPDRDILDLLSKPGKVAPLIRNTARPLYLALMINALDMMYFWMYQPCSQQTLRKIVSSMLPEEKQVLAGSQHILMQVREVSLVFVDGLLGPNFAKPLAFYLGCHETYIRAIDALCAVPPESRGTEIHPQEKANEA